MAIAVRQAEHMLKVNQATDSLGLVLPLIAEDHGHVPALEIAARAYWQLQDFVKVVELTDKLIRLNPFEPGYHSLRGISLRALGRYGDAARSLSRDPGAEDALHELEGFQASLVRDLIESDPIFAAQYAKDPTSALAAKGFYFERTEAAAAWVAENAHRPSTYTRPS